MSPMLLYITAADRQEALSISKALLEERLIACATITEQAASLYWWRGEIEQTTEAVIIAKTLESLVAQTMERIRTLHSYACPCILALPVTSVNPAYLEWIQEETMAKR